MCAQWSTFERSCLLVMQIFIGQVLGTSVGTHVFINFGWRAGAALGLGWTAWQVLILLLRGPHCRRHTWFGYEGGFRAKREKMPCVEASDEMVDARKPDLQEKPPIDAVISTRQE